jgi:quercetin dioxygenase-like cupin family protein
MSNPFRSFDDREPHPFRPGIWMHSIGGEQVALCRVRYDAGTDIAEHSHEHTEQVMLVLEGDVTMTVDGVTRTLGAGDVAVINRGLAHALRSEHGCVFVEALAPVPLDHIPDRDVDLVLGPDGGASHVER